MSGGVDRRTVLKSAAAGAAFAIIGASGAKGMDRNAMGISKAVDHSKLAGRERFASPEHWRDLFAKDEVIQRVRPTETDRWLGNPHRGTTTFQRLNGDPLYPDKRWNDSECPLEFGPAPADLSNGRYPNTTVAYLRWLWDVLEPKQGRYRWDGVEAGLSEAARRGQTVQVRVQPYIGARSPAWYWATGAKSIVEGRNDRAMDHNDPLYLEHWGHFIRAFAERFDGHPAMESFDVAYGGSCGETGGNASDETAEKLVDLYYDAFRKTQLVLMLDTHGSRYIMGRDQRLGWRVDCYGDLATKGQGQVPDGLNWNHMYSAYPKDLYGAGAVDRWMTAPVTLETCGTVASWFDRDYDLDYIIEQGYMYHVSLFMPKSVFIPDECREKIDEFDRKIGYRFVLRNIVLPLEVRRQEAFKAEVYLNNVGCAPIYRPYAFAWRFTQNGRSEVVLSRQDITKWLPGQVWFEDDITMPGGFEPGPVAVDVVLLDPATRQPRVVFAVEEVTDDRWHPLTYLDIL